jgi:hypothetical protein
VVIAGSLVPPVATADTQGDPCGLAVNLFCRFLPIAAELEGDVDLTRRLPPAPPGPTMPVESQVPADLCAPVAYSSSIRAVAATRQHWTGMVPPAAPLAATSGRCYDTCGPTKERIARGHWN